jgi:hypothetical protein
MEALRDNLHAEGGTVTTIALYATALVMQFAAVAYAIGAERAQPNRVLAGWRFLVSISCGLIALALAFWAGEAMR